MIRKEIKEMGDKQDKIAELLGELLKWIKVTSIPHVKTLLQEILQSDKEKIAYHYSDGRSIREVAKSANVGLSTVDNWWKTWSKYGIVELVSVKRGKRVKRIFSLEDFGVKVPKLKMKKENKKEVGLNAQK